jgi:hypothetical protein
VIFSPPQTRGPLLLGTVAAVALTLAIALIVRGASLPVSFAALLSYTAGAVLVAAALPLGYWAWAAASLRYELRRDALVVRWGLVDRVVPVAEIERAVLGRHLAVPNVSGLRLAGVAVGRANVLKVGSADVYLRYRGPEDLIYLQTATGAVGLSLAEPQPFVQALSQAQSSATAGAVAAGVRRRGIDLLAFWADRTSVWLGAAALALAWLSAAIVFARYRGLPAVLTLHFPSTEAAHLGPRSAVLEIPQSALAWFAASALLAVLMARRSRGAAYLVLSGSVVAGALFVVAAMAATSG